MNQVMIKKHIHPECLKAGVRESNATLYKRSKKSFIAFIVLALLFNKQHYGPAEKTQPR
ncbi:hypothetical protein ACL2XG_23285 [Sodalis sp. RH24]|uniref:hypothetical protein n=2 Tax=Sodalis TaxID=84565 RepID=UPI0039B5F9BE